jgi:hypothetical protein
MKEHPIIFNGEMVRAILAGRKPQTRCMMKPQPDDEWHPIGWPHGSLEAHLYAPIKINKRTGEEYPGDEVFGVANEDSGWVSPYGMPGDQLWVKETFSVIEDRVIFRASLAEGVNDGCKFIWKPAIFMPRRFSRITLEIVSVRVERLQQISEEDAKVEGIIAEGLSPEGDWCSRECYKRLWKNINGKGSWEKNPWVWVIQFRSLKAEARIQKSEVKNL